LLERVDVAARRPERRFEARKNTCRRRCSSPPYDPDANRDAVIAIRKQIADEELRYGTDATAKILAARIAAARALRPRPPLDTRSSFIILRSELENSQMQSSNLSPSVTGR
jgi:hypothetical protein